MIRARIRVEGSLLGRRWQTAVAVLSEIAGQDTARGARGPGWREFGGDVGSVADGRRQAGSGIARSRARARLRLWSLLGRRWQTAVAVLSEIAGQDTARGARGPGWREFGGDVGSVADGRRQAGSGIARSRARARLNWASQGQRWGRCRVRRRAAQVSRPAIEKNRRRRVLVVTICRPCRRARTSGPGCGPSPKPPAGRRWRRSGPRGYG